MEDAEASRAGRARERRGSASRSSVALATGAALVLLATACSSVTLSPVELPLLDPSQPRDAPTVTVSSAGVTPQVLHVNAPVTVSFRNSDGAAHRFEPAPELGYGDCSELGQLGTLAPGQSGTLVITRTGLICGYHDAAGPANQAFQGLIVLH